MSDEEREAIREEAELAGLRDHPGWAVYRERLIGRLGEVFQEFLASPLDRLSEFQGAGRALWDQMREVDGSETRRIALEQEIQCRHEAALEEERARVDLESSSARTRFNQGPRRPGVPIG